MSEENNSIFYEFANYSDTGLVRNNNEDAMLLLPEDGCFAVADGMGGGEAGEIASRMVIDAVNVAVHNSENESPGERKYALLQNLIRVNSDIVSYKKNHCFQMMGSTVSAILFDSWEPSKIYCCHVGDSRIYCFRDGEIFQITTDQTLGEEIRKKDCGNIQKIAPQAFHVLTQVIGGTSSLFPEWREITTFENDIIFLCSDGVTTVLSNYELETIMQTYTEPELILNAVKKQVLANGAPDNFTMICIRLNRVPPARMIDDDDRKENDFLMHLSGKFCRNNRI